MYLDFFGLAQFFEFFTGVWDEGDYYGNVPFVGVVVLVAVVVVLGVVVGWVGFVEESVGLGPSWETGMVGVLF